jgi:hypothetical protein
MNEIGAFLGRSQKSQKFQACYVTLANRVKNTRHRENLVHDAAGCRSFSQRWIGSTGCVKLPEAFREAIQSVQVLDTPSAKFIFNAWTVGIRHCIKKMLLGFID